MTKRKIILPVKMLVQDKPAKGCEWVEALTWLKEIELESEADRIPKEVPLASWFYTFEDCVKYVEKLYASGAKGVYAEARDDSTDTLRVYVSRKDMIPTKLALALLEARGDEFTFKTVRGKPGGYFRIWWD